MNKWLILAGGLVLVGGAIWAVLNSGQSVAEIEYRYASATEGELVRSNSATGTLVPLTLVDVKSKAGGVVIKLNVEEGSVVKKGDIIGLIDPADTQATFDQASADVTTSKVRVDQAKVNLTMEERNSVDRIVAAEVSLRQAQLQLKKAEESARSQPILTRADVESAKAALEAARESQRLFEVVESPKIRRDSEGTLKKAQADLDASHADLSRLRKLLEKGYVSQSDVDRQSAVAAASVATFRLAEQRQATLESEIQIQLKSLQAKTRQAEQSYEQALANRNKIPINRSDLEIARANVKAAEVALNEARTQKNTVDLRRTDIASAIASAVKSRVAMNNAKIQLNSTTVVAPRDGIITTKYLEEGTIIPPGTSTFSQGTSLVQIADTTQMEVECLVDEADIGFLKPGQKVRTVMDAYAGVVFPGTIKRIFPSAATNQSVTSIKVRVSIDQNAIENATKNKPILRPGMNANCEFLQFVESKALTVPQQAIRKDGDQSYVLVKVSGSKKPEKRIVKTGAVGNDSIEIKDGLKVGEEVVVAEIDLKAMRERQTKMQQAQQGGGSLGSLNRGGPSQSRASGGGSGGSSGTSRSGAR